MKNQLAREKLRCQKHLGHFVNLQPGMFHLDFKYIKIIIQKGIISIIKRPLNTILPLPFYQISKSQNEANCKNRAQLSIRHALLEF